MKKQKPKKIYQTSEEEIISCLRSAKNDDGSRKYDDDIIKAVCSEKVLGLNQELVETILFPSVTPQNIVHSTANIKENYPLVKKEYIIQEYKKYNLEKIIFEVPEKSLYNLIKE